MEHTFDTWYREIRNLFASSLISHDLRRDIMSGNKEDFSVTDGVQTVNTKQQRFSTEETIELLLRLSKYARQPVCKFTMDDRVLVGRLVHKQQSTLFIKHRFGKKAIPYKMEKLQAIDILRL